MICDCDEFVDIGPRILRARRVKRSQKERKCCFCNQPLPIGEPYVSVAGVENGEFFTVGHCLRGECQ